MKHPETPPMLSYAQNAEDVVLERVFSDVEGGFYIDVGASAPIDDSVTFHFYERGWHGVNVEPDPDDYKELLAARARDINLQAAAGSGDEPLVFYPSSMRGHGTVDAMIAGQRGDTATLEVPQIPLAQIFAEYAPPGGVDFLKVDVEGWEADVLASADWDQHRPRVIVAEAVDAEGRPTHESWEPALLTAGYRFALYDGVNRFYCRDEDVEGLLPPLAIPANVLDNWRAVREVNVQARLQERLTEVEAQQAAARTELHREHEAHEGAQRALTFARRSLEAERQAHDGTRRALAATRRALESEQQAHEATRDALASVYESTSWRITAPVRDASRLAKLMRPGSGGQTRPASSRG